MREEGRRGGTGNWPRTIRRIEEEEVSDRFGPRWSWTGCVNFPKIWHEELLPTTSNFLYSLCFPGLPLCADTNSHKSGGIKWRRRGGEDSPPGPETCSWAGKKVTFLGKDRTVPKALKVLLACLLFRRYFFLLLYAFVPLFSTVDVRKVGSRKRK